jgi:histidine triad (HIT) family protein
MAECIFCRIIARDLPGEIVHEDDAVVAFRDISPQAPTHIVLVPRKHIPSTNELVAEDDRIMGHLLRVAAELAKKEQIDQRGYRLVLNCGAEAGQSVDHIHVHLLGGRGLTWPPG